MTQGWEAASEKLFFLVLVHVVERQLCVAGYFDSLVFALKTSASIIAIVAPVTRPDTVNAPMMSSCWIRGVETAAARRDV